MPSGREGPWGEEGSVTCLVLPPPQPRQLLSESSVALGFLVNSPFSPLWEMCASTGPTPRSPSGGGKTATSWPSTHLLCAGSWAGRAALSPEPQTCTSHTLSKAAAQAWDFRKPKGSQKARDPPPRWWAVRFSLLVGELRGAVKLSGRALIGRTPRPRLFSGPAVPSPPVELLLQRDRKSRVLLIISFPH